MQSLRAIYSRCKITQIQQECNINEVALKTFYKKDIIKHHGRAINEGWERHRWQGSCCPHQGGDNLPGHSHEGKAQEGRVDLLNVVLCDFTKVQARRFGMERILSLKKPKFYSSLSHHNPSRCLVWRWLLLESARTARRMCA